MGIGREREKRLIITILMHYDRRRFGCAAKVCKTGCRQVKVPVRRSSVSCVAEKMHIGTYTYMYLHNLPVLLIHIIVLGEVY